MRKNVYLRRQRDVLARQLIVTLAFVVVPLSTVHAQTATPAATPLTSTASSQITPAWLEFGTQGQLLARVVVDGDCPALEIDGHAAVMAPRAAATAEFPVVACEASVPFGAQSAAIAGQALNLPDGAFKRIAVIGDTGCRLSDWDKAYQACNDPAAWPFAEIARSVAAWDPDLVIHVGDYLYREDACPSSVSGCAGSPFGDNWQTWKADFFEPVGPLLGSAPWIVMRGNHETCSRNPEGWFRFLDPRPFQGGCARFTDPYVIPTIGISFAVIDSAEASDTSDSPEEVQEYRRQLEALAALAPPKSWLITHRPMHGVLRGEAGDVEVENASYEAATGGLLFSEYALFLSGHIHLAQSLAFTDSSGRPAQLISGNSGTALDDVPSATLTADELDDAQITEAENLQHFGFLTLEPDGDSWVASQRDAAGNELVRCVLALPDIACEDSAQAP